MIHQIRTQQSHQQALVINQVRANQQIATYQSRDAISGDRILESADGGTIRASYLSTNEPSGILSIRATAFGVPGYAIDK
jgi:hypothetical protein